MFGPYQQTSYFFKFYPQTTQSVKCHHDKTGAERDKISIREAPHRIVIIIQWEKSYGKINQIRAGFHNRTLTIQLFDASTDFHDIHIKRD